MSWRLQCSFQSFCNIHFILNKQLSLSQNSVCLPRFRSLAHPWKSKHGLHAVWPEAVSGYSLSWASPHISCQHLSLPSQTLIFLSTVTQFPAAGSHLFFCLSVITFSVYAPAFPQLGGELKEIKDPNISTDFSNFSLNLHSTRST